MPIKTVYLPQTGVADDYLMEVRIEQGNVMVLLFPHFGVRESSQEIKLEGKVSKTVDVQLKNGPAKWIYIEAQPILYMHLDDSYIFVSSAKPVNPEQLQTIAESLQPLDTNTIQIEMLKPSSIVLYSISDNELQPPINELPNYESGNI